MSSTEIYSYRPMLYKIAYNIVGCSATAEDMVQDTFVNWFKSEKQKVIDVKAYLTRSTTNICFNYLKSIKQKKEEWIDQVSNSLPSLKFNPDFASLDIKCEITYAMAEVFKKLAPAERAVFVLKGIFNFDYSELTNILDKKAENCRQLFSRAQQRLNEEKVRFSLDQNRLIKAVTDFKNATLGEYADLIDGFKNDIKPEIAEINKDEE